MKNGIQKSLKFWAVCLGCAAVLGSAHAATGLTPDKIDSGNTKWQDIQAVGYTWDDANHDGLLSMGEKATFEIVMHKKYEGIHLFDAMKVWIDGTPVTSFAWDYGISGRNTNADDNAGNLVDATNTFFFDYTFNSVKPAELTFSVMCSRDLSSLFGTSDDNPTQEDWNVWQQNVHLMNNKLQGETEHYRLSVTAVPEPETWAMMMVGLGLVGGLARRRQTR